LANGMPQIERGFPLLDKGLPGVGNESEVILR
jgi:hypothetical protein